VEVDRSFRGLENLGVRSGTGIQARSSSLVSLSEPGPVPELVPVPFREPVLGCIVEAWHTGVSRLPKQLSSNNHALDLVCALDDLKHLRLAHVTLDHVLLDVARAAQELHGISCDRHSGVSGVAFCH
jgi:hypothetical protein